MNREQALLLTVLGDFLHHRKTVPTERDYDWVSLLRYGARHRLNGIVFYQLGDRIPEPLYAAFRSDYLACIVRSRHRREIVQQVEEILRREGVDFFYVKGDMVAALYTNPLLRSMSDVDLVVPEEKLASLHEPLTEAGFELTEKGESVWAYCKERMTFELHNALITSTHREDDPVAEYLSHCWDNVEQGKLDWNVHMIYLLLHLRKHFRANGVGFRLFLDLAFVARDIPLDWDYIHAEMDRLGLWRFTLTVMNLCDLWFDTNSAPEKLTFDADFAETATQDIFRNGVFGFANKENLDNDFVNTVRSDSVPGLLKWFLTALFPGYWDLCGRERFRFLQHRPWLLPLAWIWHIILFFAEGKLIKMITSFVRFRATMASRNDTYQKWGL